MAEENSADEIVFDDNQEETEVVEDPDSTDPQTVLILEKKIRNTLATLSQQEGELAEQKEMYYDAFENDPVFREHDQEYEEAKKKRRKTKQEILKQPAVASLKERTSEIRAQVRDLRETLSEELQQYQRLTGNNIIENNEGETLEIINKAKLVKRS